MSNAIVVTASKVSATDSVSSFAIAAMKFDRPSRNTSTPTGLPVEPEVCST